MCETLLFHYHHGPSGSAGLPSMQAQLKVYLVGHTMYILMSHDTQTHDG